MHYSCITNVFHLLYDQNVISGGGWNTTDPYTVSVGSAATPVTRMLPIAGRLWCGCHNSIKILNTASLEVEVNLQLRIT